MLTCLKYLPCMNNSKEMVTERYRNSFLFSEFNLRIFSFSNYCPDMITHCFVLAMWTLLLLFVCFSEVRSFDSPPPPPRPPSPSPECSVTKCTENLRESRGQHSPPTSPRSRYKLERNYYYRPSPISPPNTPHPSTFFIFFLILHVFHAFVFLFLAF